MKSGPASSSAPVYLDYAATTPVDPRVAAAMSECLTRDGVFGNPASTTHGFGFAAARRVEQAREQVARLIGAQPAEVYFTSGATEANNLAILGVARANADRGRHIVTARTEHRSVLDPAGQLAREGFRVTYLAPDRNGLISPLALRAALRSDTQLVSIMHANNETGVVQDLAALAEYQPDLAIGTTPVVQKAKEIATPGLYFTNLISARPLMGPAGAGSLSVVVNNAIANKARFDTMRDFFGPTGEGDAAGVWQETPVMHPEFREHTRRHVIKLMKKRKAEEMI